MRSSRVSLACVLLVACGSPGGASVAPVAGPVASAAPAPSPEAPGSPPPAAPVAPAASAPVASASASAPAVAAPAEPAGPRIGSVRSLTWIFAAPSRQARQIGYIREGTSAPLREPGPTSRVGCPGGWYAVAPAGYVCLDATTTLDLSGARYRALAASAPRQGEALPYRYAFSLGAPMYNRVPTEAEQRKTEGAPEAWREPPKLSMFLSGHEELAVRDEIKATDPVPEAWAGGAPEGAPAARVRKWIPHGSMVAYSHAFEAQGRVWLLTPDQTLVPANRVRPFRTTTFKGVALGDAARLPHAWSRHDAATRYRREGESIVATDARWAPRTSVPLTGERVEQGGKTYWVTNEPGVLALEGEVTVATAREHDKMPATIEPGQRWLDVHLRAGTLVAYEGDKPVFATLVAPGAGGPGRASESNAELVKRSATPTGVYRITWKTRAAVMTPETGDPQKFWIADVPHTLYFRPPFAIHTAYWHEDFGMPKSAGCINVSPEDGRWIYAWADPPTPPGWQGSGPGPGVGVGSLLVISP